MYRHKKPSTSTTFRSVQKNKKFLSSGKNPSATTLCAVIGTKVLIHAGTRKKPSPAHPFGPVYAHILPSQNTDAPSSAAAKDVVERRLRFSHAMSSVLLVCLGNDIDEANNEDYHRSIRQLGSMFGTISTFSDADRCIEFISDTNDKKICIIICGSLGQHIVPVIHDKSQVDSIFILCDNIIRHERWTIEWFKIKGIHTHISPICEALEKATQACEQDSVPISFMHSGATAHKNLDQLDASFMYTQILKQTIFTINFNDSHIKEFIHYCQEVFADNSTELNRIDQLERTYHDKTPIWWYTLESFLYSMLNRALRLVDVQIIIRMGFFISDLHRHIENVYAEQLNDRYFGRSFVVYRGQGIIKADFADLVQTKGGLMAFNGFLSTSKNRNVALSFAQCAIVNPDLVGILFVMTIDSSVSTTPFASIKELGYYADEDEVLFSMHSVFRISDIRPIDGNRRLFQVQLALTNDDDRDMNMLTNRIQEDLEEYTGWARLVRCLLKMGEPNRAEEICIVLLEQTVDERELAPILYELAWTKDDQGEYTEAIGFNEKALALRKKYLPPDHPDLANSYNNIGNVYYNMADYSKALSYHYEALAIREKTLPPNHLDMAKSYNNIGLLFDVYGDYSKALSYHYKALEIRQITLPPNHHHIASTYSNIGVVYRTMGEYSKALSFHEKEIEINEKTLLRAHPDLAMSYNNVGLVYDEVSEYSKALYFHTKALDIRKKAFPENHPVLASSYSNIGAVFYSVGDHSKSLWHYEKALEIQEKTLPQNHPDIAATYNNMGLVYYSMKDYSRAFSFYKRSIEIAQSLLPLDHPDLQGYKRNIDIVMEKL